MTYIPYGNRIIIKKVKEESKGMIIPKSASVEEKAIGEVVAISDVINGHENHIKIGDKILYDEFAGSLIPGEEDLTILDVKYVFAIIR